MKIDENTRGSIANQEAVRLLKVWMSTLFIADCFVCIADCAYEISMRQTIAARGFERKRESEMVLAL